MTETTTAESTDAAKGSDQTKPATSPSGESGPSTEGKDDGYPEGLGDAGKRALDAERAARQTAEQKAKEGAAAIARLAEIEEAGKSELEKETGRADKAESERSRLEIENAKLHAVLAHGLALEDVALIGGDTPEAIDANAKAFAARIGSARSTRPNPELGKTEGGAFDANDWLRQAARR